MPRIVLAVLVSSLAVLGFVSMAAAAPVASAIAVQVSPREVVVPVAFKCEMVEGKLVCGKTSGSKSRDDDDGDNDDDDDRPKKSKDKVIPQTCGKKVNCDVGYVKLEKPNKHGACCEVPPKQQEAEKCKFPGQINPPNCDCPDGTEFMGYKGCIKKADPPAPVALKNYDCDVPVLPKGGVTSFGTYTSSASESEAKAKTLERAKANNHTINGSVSCKQM